MNTIIVFLIEIAVTLLASILLVGYLRPHLHRVLAELCGTDERAQFWTVFSNILLIGSPLIIAMGFRPETGTLEDSFFAIIGRLSGDLAGFLVALVLVGCVISFFALVAPKPQKAETK